MSSARPRAVEGGFWLWVLAGAGLVVLGLLGLTVPRDGVRAQLLAAGLSSQRVEAYLQLVLVQGVLAVLGGLVVGFLAAGVRRGDRRYRRAEVTISTVLSLLQLAAYLLGLGGGVLVPVVLVTASVLVYLPSAQDWFAERAPTL